MTDALDAKDAEIQSLKEKLHNALTNYGLKNQLDDGKCRFNCRTEKENFVDGWMAGARHLDDSVEFAEGPLVPCWITEQLLAEEAYDERKRRQA